MTLSIVTHMFRSLVHYTSPDAAQQAINQLNGSELDGRKLHVREDRTYIDSAEGVVIFVGNLPWSVTSESLAELFREYQPIDVHVKTNMAGRSRGKRRLRVGAMFT